MQLFTRYLLETFSSVLKKQFNKFVPTKNTIKKDSLRRKCYISHTTVVKKTPINAEKITSTNGTEYSDIDIDQENDKDKNGDKNDQANFA